MYLFSCDAQLHFFQHHYSSLQCHMITCRSVGWVQWRTRSRWSPCVRWYTAEPSCSDSLISGSRLWWRGPAALSGNVKSFLYQTLSDAQTGQEEEEFIFTSGRLNSGCESTNTRPEHSFNSYNTHTTWLNHYQILEFIHIFRVSTVVISVSNKCSLFPGLWLHLWKPILGVWIILDCKAAEQSYFYQKLSP